MRLHRLIAIILLVESRGVVKAKEMAEALEVSVRTIYRDIDTLCEAGIPLMTTSGPNGGISFVDHYSLDLNKLHGDEVIHLYLTGLGIQPTRESETNLKLQNALVKLESNLPEKYKEDIYKVNHRFLYDQTPWWGKTKKLNHLEILRKSVWQKLALKITYLKYNKLSSIKEIYPYGLVIKQLDWYLIAYDKMIDEIRPFKCERITKVEILEETYHIPNTFSLKDYWYHSLHHFKDQKQKEERYEVKVKLNRNDAFILNNLEIIHRKLINNELYATVNMYKYEFACNEAREICGFVEILDPPEIRIHIKKYFTRMLNLYHEGRNKNE